MELVRDAHFIINLAEFEKSIDIDFPTLRKDLHVDPKLYRPLAVRAAGALILDKEMCKSKNYHDLCITVSDSTYQQIIGNEKIMSVLRLEREDIRLLSAYLGRLVVNIRNYVADRIESMLVASSYCPLKRVETSVSEIMQFGAGDDLAIYCEIEFEDPTPKALSHEPTVVAPTPTPPPAGSSKVVSTKPVGPSEAPWAADAKW